jgi:hypothetical protein
LLSSPTLTALTRNVLRWLATIWIIALVGGSLMPSQAKIALGLTTLRFAGPYPPNREHRFAHSVGFGGAELLFLFLATNRRQQAYRVIDMVGLGLAIELTQHFILGGRYLEWWDVRDDVIGIFTALLIVDITRVGKWLFDERGL